MMKPIFYLYIISIILFILATSGQAKEEQGHKDKKKVQMPAVAGQFYPGEKEKLMEMIREFFDEAKGQAVAGKIMGLVSPHAGYIYSGPVAATGYRQLDPHIKTVFVLAPSHFVTSEKASIPDVAYYRTPVGDIPLSSIAATLRRQKLFSPLPAMHQREHSLEVQLPFLQAVLKDFELIPIVIGQASAKSIAAALLPFIGEDTLIVASSDLSHYYPYAEAKALDNICIEAITTLNFAKMEGCEACGKIPILVLMEIARQKGWKVKLIDARNSGDTAGPHDQVVGYCSIAFVSDTKEKESDLKEKDNAEKIKEDQEAMREADKKNLLKLARLTITKALIKEDYSLKEEDFSPYLKEKRGCFVTLHKNGSLRGCIGSILPEDRLCDCVRDNALNAAFHDPRFSPVHKEELGKLEIEISVLTLPKPLKFKDSEDLKRQLRPGQDGVILSQEWRRATFLPQVWEQLPGKESFLENLCQKAGLSPHAWKDTKTKVEVYEAIVFSE